MSRKKKKQQQQQQNKSQAGGKTTSEEKSFALQLSSSDDSEDEYSSLLDGGVQLEYNASQQISDHVQVSQKDKEEHLASQGILTSNSTSSGGGSGGEDQQESSNEDNDPEEAEEYALDEPDWMNSDETKSNHFMWAKQKLKLVFLWPARVMQQDEVNANRNTEDLENGELYVEWLGTPGRNIEKLTSDLCSPYDGPDSEVSLSMERRFHKNKNMSKMQSERWKLGVDLMRRGYAKAEERRKQYRDLYNTSSGKKARRSSRKSLDEFASARGKPPEKAYSNKVETLENFDVTLHVGDVIAYNDDCYAKGGLEGRRIATIVSIDPKEEYPLELDDNAKLGRDRRLKLDRRADGTTPPPHMRLMVGIHEYKLAEGEPRLDQVMTKQDRIDAIVNRVSDNLKGAMKDFNDGKDFPDDTSQNGRSEPSSSGSSTTKSSNNSSRKRQRTSKGKPTPKSSKRKRSK